MSSRKEGKEDKGEEREKGREDSRSAREGGREGEKRLSTRPPLMAFGSIEEPETHQEPPLHPLDEDRIPPVWKGRGEGRREGGRRERVVELARLEGDEAGLEKS